MSRNDIRVNNDEAPAEIPISTKVGWFVTGILTAVVAIAVIFVAFIVLVMFPKMRRTHK